MEWPDRLSKCEGFEWDAGNSEKIRTRHQVTSAECEQLFFNQPLVNDNDEEHSVGELRFYALGRTDAARLLFVVFTLRGRLIRIISARDMSREERRIYARL
jgi:hypothetical protein